METKFTIENFKITQFSNLLRESLKTNASLILQFRDGMIKSASFSKTKSLIKLWQIPIDKLIQENLNESVEVIPETKRPDINQFNDLDFNFYILKGDLFLKFLDVFKSATVSLEFVLSGHQALSVKVTGKTETNYFIETTFPLTNEEMITDKVDDYSSIIDQCTPEEGMSEFLLTQNYFQEIKKLVKNLHQVTVDNSAYLTFEVSKNYIKVYDKVFDIDLPNIESKNIQQNETISFNILKSDFILPGEHNYVFYTDNESQKVIMNTLYNNSLMCCVCTKVGNTQMSIEDDEDILDSFDISNYDLDDM